MSRLRGVLLLAPFALLAGCGDDSGGGGGAGGAGTAGTTTSGTSSTDGSGAGGAGSTTTTTTAQGAGGSGVGGAGSGGAGGDGAGGSGSGGGTDVIGPTGSEHTPSGPIVLESGMTVTGLHITNPDGPCIEGIDVEDVRITDNLIGPCGPTADGLGVSLERAAHVRVDHNAFDDVASALYVNNGDGGGDGIQFHHNRATRIRGPFPRGQLVQFNTVSGSDHHIRCNISDLTTPGYIDGPEDHVNMFNTNGTAESPIVVQYNRIRGGGPSESGGGLLAGDYTSSYIDILDNVLVEPGNYGVAVAGGTHVRLLRNRIFSEVVYPWSNIGLYVWNQSPDDPCSDHEVRDNRVFYVGELGPNPAWDAGNCGPIAGWDDNVWGDESLDAAMFDASFPECE